MTLIRKLLLCATVVLCICFVYENNDVDYTNQVADNFDDLQRQVRAASTASFNNPEKIASARKRIKELLAMKNISDELIKRAAKYKTVSDKDVKEKIEVQTCKECIAACGDQWPNQTEKYCDGEIKIGKHNFLVIIQDGAKKQVMSVFLFNHLEKDYDQEKAAFEETMKLWQIFETHKDFIEDFKKIVIDGKAERNSFKNAKFEVHGANKVYEKQQAPGTDIYEAFIRLSPPNSKPYFLATRVIINEKLNSRKIEYAIKSVLE